MKNVMTILFSVSVVLFLLAGNLYWIQKTTVHSTAAVTPVSYGSSGNRMNLAKNWPDQALKQLEKSEKEGKPFQVAFVGSKALGKADTAGPSS